MSQMMQTQLWTISSKEKGQYLGHEDRYDDHHHDEDDHHHHVHDDDDAEGGEVGLQEES